VRSIDINADLGESYGVWQLGDDAAMLDLVTSANIACGFHAGDPSTVRRTCAAAAARGVVIGAQVGYPDLAGFGRRFIDIAADELRDAVLYQIGALDALARAAGARVRYVKPHGALYHACRTHPAQREAVVAAVTEYDASLPILGSPGVGSVPEAYADRAYQPDGTLVPRTEPGAVIHDSGAAASQALRIADQGWARSICVHGDTPDAVAIASAVRSALVAAGVAIEAFAG